MLSDIVPVVFVPRMVGSVFRFVLRVNLGQPRQVLGRHEALQVGGVPFVIPSGEIPHMDFVDKLTLNQYFYVSEQQSNISSSPSKDGDDHPAICCHGNRDVRGNTRRNQISAWHIDGLSHFSVPQPRHRRLLAVLAGITHE